MERLKSNDVLDATHEVIVAFRATVVGAFRRVGPNSWDDYEFVRRVSTGEMAGNTDDVEVLPRVPVQFERSGFDLRLRSVGKVLRVRFLPSEIDVQALSLRVGESFDVKAHARALREYFEEKYLRALEQDAPRGVAAVIVGKLSGR